MGQTDIICPQWDVLGRALMSPMKDAFLLKMFKLNLIIRKQIEVYISNNWPALLKNIIAMGEKISWETVKLSRKLESHN